MSEFGVLEKVYGLQQLLMHKLGIVSHEEERIDIYHPEFIAACIGLASEAIEVLDEVNVATRPWAVKSEDVVQEMIAKEAIDALFYFLEIMILLRITPTMILELYEEKWQKNLERLDQAIALNTWVETLG
jgi:NTP pyrophosphatase (non-canonical NTP hydrolase)